MLRKLTLSHVFCHSLEGVRFPEGLREIRFGQNFNSEISGVIWPKSSEILEFGEWFDKPLVSPGAAGGAPLGRKHTIPAGLKRLNVAGGLNQPLSGSELPKGRKELDLEFVFEFLSSVLWPLELERLYLDCAMWFINNTSRPWLSPKLKSLALGSLFYFPLTRFAFPPTLKVLDIGSTFNHPIGRADGDAPLPPDGLEELRVSESFNQSIENIRLPVGLKRLIVTQECSRFNQGLASITWPPGLEDLTLGDSFN